MLVVKTKLKEFEGKGIGVIADEEIKEGQSVWVFNPLIDIKIKKSDIPKEAESFFHTYAVDIGEEGYIYLNIDNARFFNHSDDPNIKSLGNFNDEVAIRDIHIGEEITVDYNAIDVNGVDF